jgi:hypothetical protein
VKVCRGEGLASHTSPKPCAVIREDHGEASVGKHASQPLCRESSIVQGADKDRHLKGNTNRHDNASSGWALRGQRPWRAWKSSAREPGEIATDQRCWPALGRRTRRSQ